MSLPQKFFRRGKVTPHPEVRSAIACRATQEL